MFVLPSNSPVPVQLRKYLHWRRQVYGEIHEPQVGTVE